MPFQNAIDLVWTELDCHRSDSYGANFASDFYAVGDGCIAGVGADADGTCGAGAIGHDLRTVSRIVDDYERAVQLPTIVLDAMRGRHLDPAAAKNIPILENLVQMPNPETREAAAEAVADAVQKHEAQKKEKRKAAAKPSEMGLEVFAETVVKLFKERFQSATPSEKSTVVQFVLELVVNTLQVPLQELHQYDPPTLVPKPVMKNAA